MDGCVARRELFLFWTKTTYFVDLLVVPLLSLLNHFEWGASLRAAKGRWVEHAGEHTEHGRDGGYISIALLLGG